MNLSVYGSKENQMLYCRTCRGEFVDGILQCKKCGCELVAYEELIPMCFECKKTFSIGTKQCPECKNRTRITPFDEEELSNIEFKYIELVSVYEAPNEIELAIVKGAHETNGIAYYAKGENIVAIEGLGSIGGYNPIFGPIIVHVAERDYQKAMELISEML